MTADQTDVPGPVLFTSIVTPPPLPAVITITSDDADTPAVVEGKQQ
jgi:hypothetical protein